MSTQEQAARITKKLANEMLAPVQDFQRALTDPGRDALLTILDAMAWNAGVMIARIPRQERMRLREHIISRMDETIEALKNEPVRSSRVMEN